MACVVATIAEAVVVSAIKKKVLKKERNISASEVKQSSGSGKAIPLSEKIGWLSKMLWGGSFLLVIEHMWHGEIVPWPPFLTAMSNPADIAPMLREIATVGLSMSLFITAVWGVIVAVTVAIEKNAFSRRIKES